MNKLLVSLFVLLLSSCSSQSGMSNQSSNDVVSKTNYVELYEKPFSTNYSLDSYCLIKGATKFDYIHIECYEDQTASFSWRYSDGQEENASFTYSIKCGKEVDGYKYKYHPLITFVKKSGDEIKNFDFKYARWELNTDYSSINYSNEWWPDVEMQDGLFHHSETALFVATK